MDQEERCDRIETSKNLSQLAGNSNNWIGSESVLVKNSEENAGLGLQNDGFGLCKHQEMGCVRGIGDVSSRNDQSTGNLSCLVEGNVLENEETDMGVKNNGVVSSQEINEMKGAGIGQVDRGRSGNSDNSVDGCVVETVIVVINDTQEASYVSESNSVLEVDDNGTGSSKVLAERPIRKVHEGEDSCVIDINGSVGGKRQLKESNDRERVCRICHLTSEQSYECTDSTSANTASTDLIQLGCGCKDELGMAHSHCAEAWFKLKGNRMCEICGQSAKNITGVRDSRFIEDWHDRGSTSGIISSSDQRPRCWQGQPFCNFLMACLVIAFVLPWFFHVNMF